MTRLFLLTPFVFAALPFVAHAQDTTSDSDDPTATTDENTTTTDEEGNEEAAPTTYWRTLADRETCSADALSAALIDDASRNQCEGDDLDCFRDAAELTARACLAGSQYVALCAVEEEAAIALAEGEEVSEGEEVPEGEEPEAVAYDFDGCLLPYLSQDELSYQTQLTAKFAQDTITKIKEEAPEISDIRGRSNIPLPTRGRIVDELTRLEKLASDCPEQVCGEDAAVIGSLGSALGAAGVLYGLHDK